MRSCCSRCTDPVRESVARQAEPAAEQPWLEHYSSLTDSARTLYIGERGRCEADSPAVAYVVRGGALVAMIGNKVLTGMAASGRDFYDSLRVRVEKDGPQQGWVCLQKDAVGVRLEDRPKLDVLTVAMVDQ